VKQAMPVSQANPCLQLHAKYLGDQYEWHLHELAMSGKHNRNVYFHSRTRLIVRIFKETCFWEKMGGSNAVYPDRKIPSKCVNN
jgi:hypothetical protein